MTAGKVLLLGLALVAGGVIALSCSGPSQQTVDGYAATAPASSQQRALARAERKARKKALEEQSDAGPPPDAGPAPEPKPMTPDAGALDASGDAETDAGADAAADASADVVDAGPPPEESLPSNAEICEKLCKRVGECAKEMISAMPPGAPVGEMLANITEECAKECKEQIETSDKERIKRALACLDKSDCGQFMECIRTVLDEKK